MTVSVIVPLYHGKKYIKAMTAQLEECAEQLEERCRIELVLSNDAPEDVIGEADCQNRKRITVTVLNTEVNRGIQKARVRGLEQSHGEYVLFLDQDDKIAPSYFKSQLDRIGDCDAVVCRAVHEGRPFYNAVMVFEEAITRKYMLEKGCGIVSPGQVLIRKTSVSEIWKKNFIRSHGADDWLLWLCMFGEGKQFALNQETLYEHVVHGANAAIHTERMLKSEHEVYQILKESKIYSVEEMSRFADTIARIKTNRLALMDKFKKMFFVYNTWIALENQGKVIGDFLRNKHYRTAAIYGYGHLGRQLLGRLQKEEIEVSYLADQNAAYIEEGIPAYTLGDELPETDVVIVTLVENEEKVVQMLREKTKAYIWTIKQLLSAMEEM